MAFSGRVNKKGRVGTSRAAKPRIKGGGKAKGERAAAKSGGGGG